MRETTTMRGDIRIVLRNIETGEEKVEEFHNLVVQLGLNEMMKGLSGETVAKIDTIAIGTGTTAPALGDTAVQTPLASKTGLNVTVTRTGSVLFATTIFGANEANGTWREMALLVGSTLISRAATNTVKDSAHTGLIEWTLTGANA